MPSKKMATDHSFGSSGVTGGRVYLHHGQNSSVAVDIAAPLSHVVGAANLTKVFCGGVIGLEYERRTTQALSQVNAECSKPDMPYFLDEIASTFDENE